MPKDQPLYARLAARLIQDIKTGHYAVGSYLPTETELIEQFQISRSTARAALNQLVQLGLVSRHPGIGTRVNASSLSLEYSPSVSTIEDLINYDAATRRDVICVDNVVADEELAAKLDGNPGRRWAHVSVIRYEQGMRDTPICLNENYINEAFSSVIEGLEDYSGLIAQRISDDHGISIDEIRQSIKAMGLSAEHAKLLNCQPGDYALEITRRYYDINRTLMLIAISTHPSSRFVYTSSIKRSTSP